jgi:lipopolysaccharide/colanic/teichoic acid biosynthesis glycosyltransferase
MTRAKRTLDLVGAGAGVVVLSPLFLVVAVLVKAEDGGPVFFRQERVGYRGRPFSIWKFRTMIPGADLRGLPLTVGRDTRVTRVGAWLRRLKPRPEVPRYVASYGLDQRRVLELVPGVTDEASIRYLDESAILAAAADPEQMYVDQIIPEKIRLNLAYAAHATVWTDLRVILATVRQLFRSPDGTRQVEATDSAGGWHG